jgi:hypothetical protein
VKVLAAMPSDIKSLDKKNRKSVVESNANTRKTFRISKLNASRALAQKCFP